MLTTKCTNGDLCVPLKSFFNTTLLYKSRHVMYYIRDLIGHDGTRGHGSINCIS